MDQTCEKGPMLLQKIQELCLEKNLTVNKELISSVAENYKQLNNTENISKLILVCDLHKNVIPINKLLVYVKIDIREGKSFNIEQELEYINECIKKLLVQIKEENKKIISKIG